MVQTEYSILLRGSPSGCEGANKVTVSSLSRGRILYYILISYNTPREQNVPAAIQIPTKFVIKRARPMIGKTATQGYFPAKRYLAGLYD